MDKHYIEIFYSIVDYVSTNMKKMLQLRLISEEEIPNTEAVMMQYFTLAQKIKESDTNFVPSRDDIILLKGAAIIYAEKLKYEMGQLEKSFNGTKSLAVILDEIEQKAETDADIAKMIAEKFIIKE